MKRRVVGVCIVLALAGGLVILLISYVGFCISFRRPYRGAVEKSGLSPALVYAVIKAESGFRENAKSSAGAIGLMQLKPSTAEFICNRVGFDFNADRLTEGEYNIEIGCRYLAYLLERFSEATALAAYNAGEGTVREWLRTVEYSKDGIMLDDIPYPETAGYVKKVLKFKKIYEFLY